MFLNYYKNEKVIELARQQHAEENYFARLQHYKNRIEELSTENGKLAEELSAENKLAILENEKELSIIYLTFDICNYRQLYFSIAEELKKENEVEEKQKQNKEKQLAKETKKENFEASLFYKTLKDAKVNSVYRFFHNNKKIKKLQNGFYNLYEGNKIILKNVMLKTIYEAI